MKAILVASLKSFHLRFYPGRYYSRVGAAKYFPPIPAKPEPADPPPETIYVCSSENGGVAGSGNPQKLLIFLVGCQLSIVMSIVVVCFTFYWDNLGDH
jgi:hypothetical protein